MEIVEKWVQECFAPVVLTCTTSEVERLSQKNNLSFADLLSGFGILEHADTPMRSVNHQYTLQEFNLRFISTSQFGTLPLQDATRLINEAVMRNPPDSSNVIDLTIPNVTSVEDVPYYMRTVQLEGPEPLPWYKEFKQTLFESFRCEEYTMMCHPAVLLLVVSSTEGNPKHSFEVLGNMKNLPPVFQQGLYDVNIPKYYLVLHDVAETEGTSIDPDAILQNMDIPINAGAVLRINSIQSEAATVSKNDGIWKNNPYVKPPLFPANLESFPSMGEHLGCLLSDDDITRTRAFVRSFGLRFVLPSLESRIFQLNDIVSAMKKGVKNVFKSWLRKPKDLSRSNSNSNLTYRCDSIEAQTRLLADIAFMVHDYELALSMYRLVRDDYKSDKSMFHCANANEMIALCLLLTKGSPVQMTNALDAASATYVKVNNPITCRLAIRTAVIAGEIFNTLSRSGLFTDYMDNASGALIRGSTMEQGICSAVLMERAAVCDLQARNSKFRKYGFRMVMAGHLYSSLGHGPHAARCYALARAIYDGTGWLQVEDHINFTLAQQANRLNDPIASIKLFLKLIGAGRNSASQQEALLYEFGMIIKEFLSSNNDKRIDKKYGDPISIREDFISKKKKIVIKDLCMPKLEEKTTVVYAPMNAIGINRTIDGNTLEEEKWKQMMNVFLKEEKLHELALMASKSSLQPNKKNHNLSTDSNEPINVWLTSFSSPAFNLLRFRHKNKNNSIKNNPSMYALGEKIYVEFIMKNALSCTVNVDKIHLFGKFEPYIANHTESKVIDVPEEQLHSLNDTKQMVQVDSVNLQLLPCSEERVVLALCPYVPGLLKILGVRWSICEGDVHGEHIFDLPGPLLQDTLANRQARARAPNMTLTADVVGKMPWLGVQIEYDTSATCHLIGELIRMEMTLWNAGNAELSQLQICCTDLMLCVSMMDGSLLNNNCIDNGVIETEADKLVAPYIGSSGQVVDLSSIRLKPGEKRKFVVWARAFQSGKHQVRLLFRYSRGDVASSEYKEIETVEQKTKSFIRYVRHELDVHVVRSLAVSYSVDPSYFANGEYVLGLNIANKRRDTEIEEDSEVFLQHLICMSDSWRLEPFPKRKNPHQVELIRPNHTLGFQEMSTLYFRVIPHKSSNCEKSIVSFRENETTVNDFFISAMIFHQFPIEKFLCLENAREQVRLANCDTKNKNTNSSNSSNSSDGTYIGSNGRHGNNSARGGLRSIQSVRRENNNKAKKNTDGIDVNGYNLFEEQKPLKKKNPPPQPTTREALVVPDLDLHLILLWSSTTTCHRTKELKQIPIIGQSNLLDVKVRTPFQPNISCPLTITMEYQDEVQLIPQHGNLYSAEVDVKLTVRNDSTLSSSPLSFTLQMLHPEEEKPATIFTNNPSTTALPYFFWAGDSIRQLNDFVPDSEVQFKLKACFVAPGIYDLNRFRFLVHSAANNSTSSSSSSSTVFVFPVEYLIYVKLPEEKKSYSNFLK